MLGERGGSGLQSYGHVHVRRVRVDVNVWLRRPELAIRVVGELTQCAGESVVVLSCPLEFALDGERVHGLLVIGGQEEVARGELDRVIVISEFGDVRIAYLTLTLVELGVELGECVRSLSLESARLALDVGGDVGRVGSRVGCLILSLDVGLDGRGDRDDILDGPVELQAVPDRVIEGRQLSRVGGLVREARCHCERDALVAVQRRGLVDRRDVRDGGGESLRTDALGPRGDLAVAAEVDGDERPDETVLVPELRGGGDDLVHLAELLVDLLERDHLGRQLLEELADVRGPSRLEHEDLGLARGLLELQEAEDDRRDMSRHQPWRADVLPHLEQLDRDVGGHRREDGDAYRVHLLVELRPLGVGVVQHDREGLVRVERSVLEQELVRLHRGGLEGGHGCTSVAGGEVAWVSGLVRWRSCGGCDLYCKKIRKFNFWKQ